MLFIFSVEAQKNKKNESGAIEKSFVGSTANVKAGINKIKHLSNTEFGIPFDADTTDDFIIKREQYVLSYSHKFNVCNWVSWNLDADWYGDAERYSGSFKTDTVIPKEWYHVTNKDYSNTGYDKGHMVRSEERTCSDSDNFSTFYLTNILPQAPDLNRGVWLNLEYFCEGLCKKSNKELYVIAGGIYHSDSTLNGLGKVRIPDSCFKIIVVMDKGQGLKNITLNSEVIAVMMPNISGIHKDKWQKYITNVDKIENSTKYNFLDLLPDNIEKVLEAKKYNYFEKKPEEKPVKTKKR